MKKILLALGVLVAMSAPAWAATCPVGYLQVKDNAATTANVPYVDDASGNGYCVPEVDVFNTLSKGQATMANSSPTVIASDQKVGDPCMFQAKTNLPINNNSTSSTQLIALSSGKTIYVCSLFLMTNSTATTFAITTGTGTACATNNAAVLGSTTANIANSANLIAGAGLTFGNGEGTIASGASAGELCIILGSSVYVSGNLQYVQQ